ncbi:uncharacterized protein KY384_007795 [Bacidia gigantensis]|uniref:uncharacterized protein n=1 Tax=Bacidia gigantensis TaxID=2732470 RepID=UPI001D03D46D|nr:uncharacterized protein KY384_007795 [Bacidia gigantensis]KAG8527642.1 hypothetical protein KY384_007795 [Bacidia gigantensis]
MNQFVAEAAMSGNLPDSSLEHLPFNLDLLTDFQIHIANTTPSHTPHLYVVSEPHTPEALPKETYCESPASSSYESSSLLNGGFTPLNQSPVTPITPGSYGEFSNLNSPMTDRHGSLPAHGPFHRRQTSMNKVHTYEPESDTDTKNEASEDGQELALVAAPQHTVHANQAQNLSNSYGALMPKRASAHMGFEQLPNLNQTFMFQEPRHSHNHPLLSNRDLRNINGLPLSCTGPPMPPPGINTMHQDRWSLPHFNSVNPQTQPISYMRSTAMQPMHHAPTNLVPSPFVTPDTLFRGTDPRNRPSDVGLYQNRAPPDNTHRALQNAIQVAPSQGRNLPTLQPVTEAEDPLVQKLYKAMMNMGYTEDNKGILKTWRKLGETKTDHILQVCRDMLDLSKRRQETGQPLCETRHMGTAYSTLEKRLDALCETLEAQKTVCKHLLEDPYINRVVEDPSKATKLVKNNRRVNAQKKEAIDAGRDHKGVRGRGKGNRLEHVRTVTGGRTGSHTNRVALTRPKRKGPRQHYEEEGSDYEDDRSGTVSPPAKKCRRSKRSSAATNARFVGNSTNASEGSSSPHEEEHVYQLAKSNLAMTPGVGLGPRSQLTQGLPNHQHVDTPYVGTDCEALGPMRPMEPPTYKDTFPYGTHEPYAPTARFGNGSINDSG